jgi:hypothetical protein
MKSKSGGWLVVTVIVVAALVGSCQPIGEYLEQVYKVYGTVTDAQSGAPLESVEVFVGDSQYSELTNSYGDYELEMVEGTWTLNFVKAGYESYAVEISVGGEEARTLVDAALVQKVPPAPSVPEVETVLQGFFTWDQQLVGAVFEEWATTNETAVTGPNTTYVLHFDGSTMTQVQSYTDYALLGTPYTATGVLSLDMGSTPAPLTGELMLSGGPITSLVFDLSISLNMADPLVSTISGTVAADGSVYNIDEMPAAKQAWLDSTLAMMTFMQEAQAAIDTQGVWAGDVDLFGQPGYAVITLVQPQFEALIYDALGGTLVGGSRGDAHGGYSRYAPPDPVSLEFHYTITELYDGAAWGPPPYPMSGVEHWEKDGDVLTMHKDLDGDGVADSTWVVYRQP